MRFCRRLKSSWIALRSSIHAVCLSAVLGGAASILVSSPAAAGAEDAASFDTIRAQLSDACAARRFSGVAIAKVGRDVVFDFHCGYADFASNVPIRDSDRFKLFSISKSFTGTLVMALADRRRLSIDDPISHYLPYLPASWSGITLKQLLEHTSGIPDRTGALLETYLAHPEKGHAWAVRQAVEGTAPKDIQLLSPPGDKWSYNNFGYELLADAAAVAAGENYEQALRDYVLRPAGMRTAEIAKPAVVAGKTVSAASPGLVQGYNCSDSGLEKADSYQFVQLGAGALYASAADLLAFDDAMRNGKVISHDMQKRNEDEAYQVNAAVKYGFGWMIRRISGVDYLQHSGGNNGFVSEFARAPSYGVSVVVLSNLGCAQIDTVRRDLVAAALDFTRARKP